MSLTLSREQTTITKLCKIHLLGSINLTFLLMEMIFKLLATLN